MERIVDYDRRALTDDQRSLADDIASSMGWGHEEGCDVWSEDADGCSCPLLLAVADGLAMARVVAVEVERGYDSTIARGDRVQRMPFRPMPGEAEASVPAAALTPIACICGSTRFADHMNTEAERLTLDGMIVVRPEVVAYNRGRDQQFVKPEEKAALDELHLRKIDLADLVVVVTVDDYVGESTTREIAYARRQHKSILFREYGPAAPAAPQPDEVLRAALKSALLDSGRWVGGEIAADDWLDAAFARFARGEG